MTIKSVLTKGLSAVSQQRPLAILIKQLSAVLHRGQSGESHKVIISCHALSTIRSVLTRVSFETSLDSKQPKLEPKLVSALSETKRLFRLFRFYAETEMFDVSIEPKQTEDQPKQFKREYIWVFFRKFRVHLLTFLEMLSIYVF